MTDATLTMTVGRLFWRHVRKAVEQSRFLGWKVEMFEGAGFLDRQFIIKGDAKAVQAIHDHFARLAR